MRSMLIVLPLAAAVAAVVAADSADWPQWGGSPGRNAVSDATGIPTDWDAGSFDFDTGEWDPTNSKNIKWVARLGFHAYGNPVVADGQIYVGTNNDRGYVKRFPDDTDLGVLLCLRAADGSFLWQHANEKLASGAANDYPKSGVCSSPLVEGERLWYVTNRCEVVCLDTKGFHDGENDGPFTGEANNHKDEADVIWSFDMIGRMGVHPLYMSNCSVTGAGDLLFVSTSNGAGEDERDGVPAPDAPSFIALEKATGKLVWESNAPGKRLLRGQWSSPAFAMLGPKGSEVPQAIFAGGDGWVYSFHATAHENGTARLLWKFDTNPKESVWEVRGQAERNYIVATPVIHDGYVYIANGQEPDAGAGPGTLWCIDPNKRGDVSETRVYASADAAASGASGTSGASGGEPLPPRREQSLNKQAGEVEKPNPNSAVVWKYTGFDFNGDGELQYEEQMHRTIGNVAVKDGLLFVGDFGGVVHCLDAKTGRAHWTQDVLTALWGSPLIVRDRVYIADEQGTVHVYALSKDMKVIAEPRLEQACHGSPIVAGGVLYIGTSGYLFAIEEGAKAPTR